MAQQVRRRHQQTVPFATNNKESKDLSRGMVYRELQLRLRGAPTVTAGNNTQAKTKTGDEWAIVKRIDIIANNTEVIRSFSGNALWWFNYFFYGARPQVTATLGDGSTANPSFDSVLKLPFWMPQSIRPIDTALDARKLSDLKIEVTWGTFTDINGDASAWTTTPTLDVSSTESFNIDGEFAQSRIYTIEKEITATNSAFQIQLPVGPLFRGFMMNFTDAAADDGAVLNNFKWKSGTTTFADVRAAVLWQEQLLRYNNQRNFTGQVYDDDRIGNDNNIEGWYLYDHVNDGFLSEGVDTLGFSENELELDVTLGSGTTKVFVFPIQIFPVRKQKAA